DNSHVNNGGAMGSGTGTDDTVAATDATAARSAATRERADAATQQRDGAAQERGDAGAEAAGSRPDAPPSFASILREVAAREDLPWLVPPVPADATGPSAWLERHMHAI